MAEFDTPMPDQKPDGADPKDANLYVRLAAKVTDDYAQARDNRKEQEKIAIRMLRAYNGIEPMSEQFQTDVFIKLTRHKVSAAIARELQAVFPNVGKTWDLKPTPLTRLAEQVVAQGGTADDLVNAQRQSEQAMTLMRKRIADDLVHSKYSEQYVRAALDHALFGTMVWFGPYAARNNVYMYQPIEGGKTYERVLDPEYDDRACVEWIDFWAFYPDPGAEFDTDMSYAVIRRTLNKKEMRVLARTEGYFTEEINKVIASNPTGRYTREWWESQKEKADEKDANTQGLGRYLVLEWWGYMTPGELEDMGVPVEYDPEDRDSDFIWNVWTVDGRVIYIARSEFHRERLPFYVTPYERIPGKVWGRGVAEMMEDSQRVINSLTRAFIDNMSFSAGPMMTVDTSRATGNYMKLHPRKILTWERKDFADTTNPYMPFNIPTNNDQIINFIGFFKTLVQDVTSLPDAVSGTVPMGGSGVRTIGQTSMYFNAADSNTKLVIMNIDTTHTAPLIRALYDWNMLHGPGDARGDFSIEALGVSGVIAREAKVNDLNQALQLIAQDEDASVIIDKSLVYRKLFELMEFDGESFMRTESEAEQYVEKLQQQKQQEAELANMPKQQAEITPSNSLAEIIKNANTSSPDGALVFSAAAKELVRAQGIDAPDLMSALEIAAEAARVQLERVEENLEADTVKKTFEADLAAASVEEKFSKAEAESLKPSVEMAKEAMRAAKQTKKE